MWNFAPFLLYGHIHKDERKIKQIIPLPVATSFFRENLLCLRIIIFIIVDFFILDRGCHSIGSMSPQRNCG